MRVCVAPVPSTLSRAMYRVADALARWAPPGVEIVDTPGEADLQILHVIGPGVRDRWLAAPDYAVIQYCVEARRGESGANLRVRGAAADLWEPLWRGRAVWSYYDLPVPASTRFHHAPLGVDPIFAAPPRSAPRTVGLVTSGYVSGPGAEPIEEATRAAHLAGLETHHVGPSRPQGFDPSTLPGNWRSTLGLSDPELACLYRRSLWVSGLRHVEGFELPVVEGLACGCRPIVFDRPETRQWFDGHAVFIPEAHGEELVGTLTDVFSSPPDPVDPAEREDVLSKFSWASLVPPFWDLVLSARGEVAA